MGETEEGGGRRRGEERGGREGGGRKGAGKRARRGQGSVVVVTLGRFALDRYPTPFAPGGSRKWALAVRGRLRRGVACRAGACRAGGWRLGRETRAGWRVRAAVDVARCRRCWRVGIGILHDVDVSPAFFILVVPSGRLLMQYLSGWEPS